MSLIQQLKNDFHLDESSPEDIKQVSVSYLIDLIKQIEELKQICDDYESLYYVPSRIVVQYLKNQGTSTRG